VTTARQAGLALKGEQFALGRKRHPWENPDWIFRPLREPVMRYLIDGYNLLHAMGLLSGKAGPHGLEKARINLLGRLAGAYGPDAGNVTVVFDASRSPPGADAAQTFQGIRVHYTHQQEADDLIEAFIQHHASPRQLTVVSNDRRLKDAARRRQCRVLDCADFLERLDRQRRANELQPTERHSKPQDVSRAETQHWLREFRDLADDPKLRGWVDLGQANDNAE
jgi:predicted RNA-binding protein with PIN domain